MDGLGEKIDQTNKSHVIIMVNQIIGKKDYWKLKGDIAKGIMNADGEKNTTTYASEGDLVVVSNCGGACCVKAPLGL